MHPCPLYLAQFAVDPAVYLLETLSLLLVIVPLSFITPPIRSYIPQMKVLRPMISSACYHPSAAHA